MGGQEGFHSMARLLWSKPRAPLCIGNELPARTRGASRCEDAPQTGFASPIPPHMHTFRIVLIIILAALCLPLSAHARRPRGTEMTGVISQVDHSTRTIVLAQEAGALRSFVYAERAKFWQDSQKSSPAALRPGMRVQVALHRPLIGPDFVTVIRLLAPAGDK